MTVPGPYHDRGTRPRRSLEAATSAAEASLQRDADIASITVVMPAAQDSPRRELTLQRLERPTYVAAEPQPLSLHGHQLPRWARELLASTEGTR